MSKENRKHVDLYSREGDFLERMLGGRAFLTSTLLISRFEMERNKKGFSGTVL